VKHRNYPRRSGSPPPAEDFAAERAAFGSERIALDFGGLGLVVDGLDRELADGLRERFPHFVTGDPADIALRIELRRETGRTYFIDPPEGTELHPVWIACDGATVRYASYTLAAKIDAPARTARFLLAGGSHEPPARAIENALRCAIACAAAERGGALLHAASCLRNGRGYVFFGASGAGKSTIASVDTRGRFVSDDLTLLVRAPGGALSVVGGVFPGPFEAEPLRAPLAAGFRLVQAEAPAIVSASRTILFGQVVANLPFLVETLDARPDLFARLEETFAGVPLFHLHFRKDDSYWDVIDRAGL
jgi:hypothetical protein